VHVCVCKLTYVVMHVYMYVILCKCAGLGVHTGLHVCVYVCLFCVRVCVSS